MGRWTRAAVRVLVRQIHGAGRRVVRRVPSGFATLARAVVRFVDLVPARSVTMGAVVARRLLLLDTDVARRMPPGRCGASLRVVAARSRVSWRVRGRLGRVDVVLGEVLPLRGAEGAVAVGGCRRVDRRAPGGMHVGARWIHSHLARTGTVCVRYGGRHGSVVWMRSPSTEPNFTQRRKVKKRRSEGMIRIAFRWRKGFVRSYGVSFGFWLSVAI